MGWPGHKQKRRTLSKPCIYLQGETFSTLKAEIDLLLLKFFRHCNICCGSNLINLWFESNCFKIFKLDRNFSTHNTHTV